MINLHLDYEAYSDLDITTVGGGRYVRDPSTEALMLGWELDGMPRQVWQPHTGGMPGDLYDALRDPNVLKWAFNAPFEWGITEHVLQVDVPPQTWRCTMFLAYGMAFTGGLDRVLKQAGFPEHMWKDADGKRLIRKFSMPQPANRKVRRWYYHSAPEDWEKFVAYCDQDVAVEKALKIWLMQFDPISDDEWMTWHMDQDINHRGLPVDRALINTARALVKLRKDKVLREMREITGLQNPGSNAQLLPWLQAQGVPVDNMQAETLRQHAEHRVVQLKLWYSQTATAKWDAFDAMACPDDTLKGMFVSGGASRTRRYASRGINMQNLKRPIVDDMDGLCHDIRTLQLDRYEHEPLDLLATSVRGAIAAPPGCSLAVCDLGSIESRVLGWIADCRWINDTFAGGLDTYKSFATYLYKVPYDAVTPAQRKFSKPPVLGAGYQLGAGGLVGYAESMGVEMTREQAHVAVDTFRDLAHEVRSMWRWLTDTCVDVINTGRAAAGYKCRFYRDNQFLYIELPSGRRLAYHQPMVVDEMIHWTDRVTGEPRSKLVPNVTYMGINRFNLQWERISTHGGGITENIVQAISRDLLVYQMRLAANRGHDIRGHVHDEIITVCPAANADVWLESLQGLMCVAPPWATGLLLDATGYVGQHYRKD